MDVGEEEGPQFAAEEFALFEDGEVEFAYRSGQLSAGTTWLHQVLPNVEILAQQAVRIHLNRLGRVRLGAQLSLGLEFTFRFLRLYRSLRGRYRLRCWSESKNGGDSIHEATLGRHCIRYHHLRLLFLILLLPFSFFLVIVIPRLTKHRIICRLISTLLAHNSRSLVQQFLVHFRPQKDRKLRPNHLHLQIFPPRNNHIIHSPDLLRGRTKLQELLSTITRPDKSRHHQCSLLLIRTVLLIQLILNEFYEWRLTVYRVLF